MFKLVMLGVWRVHGMSHFAYLFFVLVKPVSGTNTEHCYLQEYKNWEHGRAVLSRRG